MISEQAVVTRRDGARVEVRLMRESVCGGCELGKGCGTGALGRLLGNRDRPLSIECSDPLEPGDRIELRLSESALVRASLVLYGLPLVVMLAAGLLAAVAGVGDLAVAAVAIAGLYLGFRLAARYSARLDRHDLKPQVVDIRTNPDNGRGADANPRV